MRALENRKSLPQSAENPFEDVKPGDYFYNAVLWVVGKNITGGTIFSPGLPCTQGQIVMFLYRDMGE